MFEVIYVFYGRIPDSAIEQQLNLWWFEL